jgi:hypothetical protein
VVLLILAAIWAVVLIPPWIRSRREAMPARSMASFQHRLSSLERATPYGYAYAGDMYRDVASDDGLGPGAGDDDPAGGARADVPWGEPVEAVSGVVTVTQSAGFGQEALGLAPVTQLEPRTGATAVAVMAARASSRLALRRRRRAFFALLVGAAATLAVAAVLNSIVGWAVHGAFALLFLGYVALLVRHQRRAIDRAAKVRYLRPMRAPRPAVVVLHGTAR